MAFAVQPHEDADRPADWDVARYQQELEAIPERETLIDTPYMLWLTLSVLPELVKEQQQRQEKTQSNPSTQEDKSEQKGPKQETGTSVSTTPSNLPQDHPRRFIRALYGPMVHTRGDKVESEGYLQHPEKILGKSAMATIRQQAGDQRQDVQRLWLKHAYRVFAWPLPNNYLQEIKSVCVKRKHPITR